MEAHTAFRRLLALNHCSPLFCTCPRKLVFYYIFFWGGGGAPCTQYQPEALTKSSASGLETVLLFLSHLKPGGVCWEEYGKTCWASSPEEKSWPGAAPAGTVSVPIALGTTGQPRTLLQGSGKDREQLYVPGTGCTKGLHPGWGKIHYPLPAPVDKPRRRDFCFSLSLGQGHLNTLFSEGGESHQSCPSFPFSSPDSAGCFPRAALISSQAPPCRDGGTLFLENLFNRKSPWRLPVTPRLRLLGAEPWALQRRTLAIPFSRTWCLLQLPFFWCCPIPLKFPLCGISPGKAALLLYPVWSA